jgi:catechol 2,3-dioxygenase-like lactoylglutathione lyase family enzyme
MAGRRRRHACTRSRAAAFLRYADAMPGNDAPLSPAPAAVSVQTPWGPTLPGRTADVVVTAIPVLHVADADRSVRFYCGRLGFRQDWWHQAGPDEPATVSVSRGGASVILTQRSDVGRGGQICLWTIELDTLAGDWGALDDVVFEHGPTAMPWGLTEIAFCDPDGNRIRVAQPTGCQT